jgi:transcriptional regulator with XRE-family HTH domain
MKIGEKIKEIREMEKKLTQKYVAERAGMNVRSLQNIENNVADVSYSRLHNIAEAIEVSVQYIVNYKENNANTNNNFYNQNGNKGINILNQGNDINTIHNMYAQMLALKDEVINTKNGLIEYLKSK